MSALDEDSVLEEIVGRASPGGGEYEDDDDLEEVVALLSSTPRVGMKGASGHAKGTRNSSSWNGWKWWMTTVFIVVIPGVIVVLYQTGPLGTSSSSSSAHNPMLFTCPPTPSDAKKPLNYDESFVEDYENATMAMSENMTEFLDNLHQMEYDGWRRTYDNFKAALYEWKKGQFVPYLNDGDAIFESAMGIGLNMYMTLEILQEVKGVHNIRVFGNEYEVVSAKKANQIYDEIPPAQAKKGVICAADSTDLSYVPANSFDLVFTGYLRYVSRYGYLGKCFFMPFDTHSRNHPFSPLSDPLHLNNESIYDYLCESGEEDWRGTKLSEVAQEEQEKWFGLWVGQMLRIAKRGAPVIIENVAPSYCKAPWDWGGADKEFWAKAVIKYGWHVDPNSFYFEDHPECEGRYHVSMKKA